jgi:hypothetical protein
MRPKAIWLNGRSLLFHGFSSKCFCFLFGRLHCEARRQLFAPATGACTHATGTGSSAKSHQRQARLPLVAVLTVLLRGRLNATTQFVDLLGVAPAPEKAAAHIAVDWESRGPQMWLTSPFASISRCVDGLDAQGRHLLA